MDCHRQSQNLIQEKEENGNNGKEKEKVVCVHNLSEVVHIEFNGLDEKQERKNKKRLFTLNLDILIW